MSDSAAAQPQLYLVTPADPDPDSFPALLARCLDNVPVACLRLSMATTDEDRIARMADALRAIAHARDVALLIDRHSLLVERLGLDGVHLGDAPRSLARTRKALGADAIIGCHCGTSRHDGITAAEIGADYVAFGPAGPSRLGDGSRAEPGLFSWWSEMIEVPVVAEGALSPELARALGPVADFLALGDEIWSAPDPVATLAAYHRLVTAG